MTAFKFKFASLLQYRSARRDLCLQTLSQALTQERELLATRDGVDQTMQSQLADLRTLGQRGTVEIDLARTRQNYVSQLTDDLHRLEQQLELVASQVELSRTAVAQAEQDVTMLQKLAEKQAAAFRYEQQRRDVRDLDEMSHPAKAA